MLMSASRSTPAPDPTETLLTDLQIAARLGVSRRHVHALRSKGILRAVKLGASLRFPANQNMARILGGAKESAT